MSGECKSYRLNDPMVWEEFKSMPDDIKITYIKLLRQKYNVPDAHIYKMMGTNVCSFSKEMNRLGLAVGKRSAATPWDKEGFYAWWHGVDQLPTPVPEEPVEEPVIEEVTVITSEEPEVYVEDDLPFEESDPCTDRMNAVIDALKCRVDELMAVHEKDRAEIEWLRNECDGLRNALRMREAQLEIVQLIFGGKNNG